MSEKKALHLSANAMRADTLFIVASFFACLAFWQVTESQGYLLFHTSIELISIVVSCMVFGVAWNTRSLGERPFFLVLGIGMLGVGILDLAHAMSYRGMSILPGDGLNLPTQFWVAARYFESTAFLVAIFLLQRTKPVRGWPILLLSLLLAFGLILAIYPLDVFPDALLPTGLTRFKIISEYVIAGLFLASAVGLWRSRARLDGRVMALLITALCLKTVSEIFFALYGIDVFGTFNAIGHVLKATATIAAYMALVQASLTTPYRTLFRELENSRHDLSRELEIRRRAEESMMESKAMLRASFASAPLGFAIMDREGRFLDANSTYCRLTGYVLEELCASAFPRLVHPDDHDENLRLMQGMQAGEMSDYVIESRYVRKDKRTIWVRTSVSAVRDARGALSWFVALVEDITEKRKSDEVIWQQANFDTLTRLPNRRFFRERLEHEVRNARRSKLPLALMFIDLDGFKHVNDTFGHDMGDVLLKEAAVRLAGCVRESDTVARLGGDEFTIVLPEIHDPDNVDRVARQILRALSEPVAVGKEIMHVSASIGITLFPQDAEELEDLLKNADQAMYAAKQEGRNRYHFFTSGMQRAAMIRMRLINDLRGALAEGQIEIVYQPIVELSSGAIRKAEALIRWQHPRKGLVNPVDFISAAEDSGMISSFGNWVFHEAARQAVAWREKFHPAFQISVNISSVQIKGAGIDPSVWLEHMSALGLPGQGVVVEITERILLDANAKVTDQLLMLRDAGIEVALDDFGTGAIQPCPT